MTTIAVTGATGQLGGRVARLVADLRPRLLVRVPERAPAIEGAEVVAASYGDRAACVAALRGIDLLLMVSASESATRRDDHRTFVAAAAEAGVRHVVYTSFAGASPTAPFTLARDHFDTEQALAESGMTHTFLRDNLYLDVLPYFANVDGVIRGPAGTGRVAGVARADVAEVADAVLRSPEGHAGATYLLTGPEALTLEEVAARASSVLGERIRFEDESTEAAYAWRREQYSVEDWQLDAWVSTYTAIRDDQLHEVTDDVRRLTGHAPRSLEDVLSGR